MDSSFPCASGNQEFSENCSLYLRWFSPHSAPILESGDRFSRGAVHQRDVFRCTWVDDDTRHRGHTIRLDLCPFCRCGPCRRIGNCSLFRTSGLFASGNYSQEISCFGKRHPKGICQHRSVNPGNGGRLPRDCGLVQAGFLPFTLY